MRYFNKELEGSANYVKYNRCSDDYIYLARLGGHRELLCVCLPKKEAIVKLLIDLRHCGAGLTSTYKVLIIRDDVKSYPRIIETLVALGYPFEEDVPTIIQLIMPNRENKSDEVIVEQPVRLNFLKCLRRLVCFRKS